MPHDSNKPSPHDAYLDFYLAVWEATYLAVKNYIHEDVSWDVCEDVEVTGGPPHPSEVFVENHPCEVFVEKLRQAQRSA